MHAARVLELVNHHVVKRGTHLLEDERGIAGLGQSVEQGGGICQQEAVLLLIEGAHLLGQMVEQLQFAQVLQRELAAVDGALGLLATALGLCQQGDELLLGQTLNPFALLRALGDPLVGALQAFGERGVRYFGIAERALGYLAEVAAHAALTALKVGRGQLVAVQQVVEQGGVVCHLVDQGALLLLQQLLVLLHVARCGQAAAQLFAPFDILLAEDVAAKLLHLGRHVPAAVLLDALADVLHQPVEHGRGGGELLHHALHGVGHHAVAVQLHGQPRVELELAAQVAHHRLKEAVDGLHAEAAVVVDQGVEGL